MNFIVAIFMVLEYVSENKYLTIVQLNQQYIVEGFTAGFMMLLTSSGLMILDQSNYITSTKYRTSLSLLVIHILINSEWAKC